MSVSYTHLPAGEESYAKWHAFGKFMKEFTLIEEKDYPSLELWEKYLVYATAMGISKEVLKQIKIAYPQMYDSNYTGMYLPYSYLYFAHINGGMASIESTMGKISSSMQSIQNSLSYTPNSGEMCIRDSLKITLSVE